MFEWDEAKRALNLAKHGIDFAVVQRIWDHPLVTRLDNRRDYGEARWMTLGRLDDEIVLVVHTARTGNIRIISIRRANKRECKIYEETVGPVGGSHGL